MKRILLFCVIFLLFNNTYAQPPIGDYEVNGYFFRSAGSRWITQGVKSLTLISPNVYEVIFADLGSAFTFRFSIDASNHLVNWVPGGNTPALPASGFMTADNPGNFTYTPFQPGTNGFTHAIYNNIYDPVSRCFYMHYGYKAGSTGENGYTQQVYEKWSYIPVPHITSVEPLSGNYSTKITIHGSGFTAFDTDYNNVQFGGILADSISILSDSLIYAWPSNGASGNITLGNYYFEDTIPGFTYIAVAPATDLQWQYLGSAGFSASRSSYINAGVDNADNQVVAFVDSVSGKAMAMKYTSGIWNNLGSAISSGKCSHLKMSIDNAGNPIIGYVDSTNLNRITIKKFNGSSWTNLLMPATTSYAFALTVDHNNNIYLGNILSSFTLSIYQFNGSSWAVSSNLTSVSSSNFSMATDTITNTAYITFPDHFGQNTVMKYSGGSWVIVGNGGYTNAWRGIFYPDIKIDKNSVPITLMQDDNGFERLGAYTLSGNIWTSVGSPYFSKSHSYWPSLALDNYNTPFAAFYDIPVSAVTVRTLSPITNNWDTVGARGFLQMRNQPGAFALTGDNNHNIFLAYADESAGGKISVKKINSLCYNNINIWTGTVSSVWENPANWSCGIIPQISSNVLIPAGAVVVLSSSTTISSLKTQPGASLTVAGDVVLAILNP